MAKAPKKTTDRWVPAATLAGLLALQGLWAAGAVPGVAGEIVATSWNPKKSAADEDLQVQNYYEELLNVDSANWRRGRMLGWIKKVFFKEERSEEGGNWVRLEQSGLTEETDDPFLKYELIPSFERVFMGVPVKTNQWRMRDEECDKAPPPRVCRIGFVEASNMMGYGVEGDLVAAELLEDRLNAEFAGKGAYDRYEVLNFSVGGYQILDRLYQVDDRMSRFGCHLMLVGITMNDLRWAVYVRLAQHIVKDRDLHYDFLRRICAEAGVEHGQSEARMRQKLKPRNEDLVVGCFEELLAISRRAGAPLYLLNFRLRVDAVDDEMRRQTELARSTGLPVIELFDALEGQKADDIYLRPEDQHPTELGHRLLAEELFNDLTNDPAIRALLMGEGPAGGAASGG